MTKLPVTNIIFDLGRVLIDFDHRIAARKLSALTHKSPEDIYALFFDSPLTRRFEEGQLEPEAFYGKVKRVLRLKLRYEQFLPIWNDIFFFSEQNRRVYALAGRLRARYTVSLLSNINPLHLEYIRHAFPVLEAFHHVFASCELGCMKPDPRIYSQALKALGAKPGEVFYTDDRAELIDQARVMGIRAYTYTGFERLTQDLARCGVDDSAPVPGFPG